MQWRALRSGSLVAILVALVLVTLAFAAQADDESEDRRHSRHTIMIKGFGGGGHHGALMELLGAKGGFLGVTMTELTPELRTHFGVLEDAGVMISRIVADSPAERAGLRVGDVITRVDDDDVDSSMSLKHAISQREDGEAVVLEIWRDGQMETVTANLEEREGHGLGRHRFVMDCDDGDCDFDFGRMHLEMFRGGHGLHLEGLHLGCGDSEDCNVKITCEDGDCDCVVNGETSDCSELHLNKLHSRYID